MRITKTDITLKMGVWTAIFLLLFFGLVAYSAWPKVWPQSFSAYFSQDILVLFLFLLGGILGLLLLLPGSTISLSQQGLTCKRLFNTTVVPWSSIVDVDITRSISSYVRFVEVTYVDGERYKSLRLFQVWGFGAYEFYHALLTMLGERNHLTVTRIHQILLEQKQASRYQRFHHNKSDGKALDTLGDRIAYRRYYWPRFLVWMIGGLLVIISVSDLTEDVLHNPADIKGRWVSLLLIVVSTLVFVGVGYLVTSLFKKVIAYHRKDNVIAVGTAIFGKVLSMRKVLDHPCRIAVRDSINGFMRYTVCVESAETFDQVAVTTCFTQQGASLAALALSYELGLASKPKFEIVERCDQDLLLGRWFNNIDSWVAYGWVLFLAGFLVYHTFLILKLFF